jgi:hypothetical protein
MTRGAASGKAGRSSPRRFGYRGRNDDYRHGSLFPNERNDVGVDGWGCSSSLIMYM